MENEKEKVTYFWESKRLHLKDSIPRVFTGSGKNITGPTYLLLTDKKAMCKQEAGTKTVVN